MGLYDDAEDEYREAIKASPKSVEPYYNLGVLYNSLDKTERARALFATCLELDNRFVIAREALNKLKGLNQLSDWYSWWFKSDRGKKALGLALITSISILFVITTFASLGIHHPLLQYLSNFTITTQTSPGSKSTSSNSTSSGAGNPNTPNSPDVPALIVLTILLMIFLPSLRSIKVGTIELATSPIVSDTDEIKSSTPMPSKSDYMPLHFVMPLEVGNDTEVCNLAEDAGQ